LMSRRRNWRSRMRKVPQRPPPLPCPRVCFFPCLLPPCCRVGIDRPPATPALANTGMRRSPCRGSPQIRAGHGFGCTGYHHARRASGAKGRD
jgi:hypothetical protein